MPKSHEQEYGHDPMFPHGSMGQGYEPEFGLSKREWFAGMALQGISVDFLENPGEAARRAIMFADCLIANLQEDPENE